MQLPVPGHIDPHRLAAVLNQHGGLGVLEEDVVFGVAPVELDLDFSVQVVVGVLGLPVTPCHAQAVLDGAVRLVARGGLQFRDQYESFPVVTAVGIQAVLKRWANVFFVVRPAELYQLLQLGAVLFDMRIGWHIWIISHRPSRPCGPRKVSGPDTLARPLTPSVMEMIGEIANPAWRARLPD